MSIAEPRLRAVSRDDLQERIDALGPWFHNMNLRGVRTAPDHFLGDESDIFFKTGFPKLHFIGRSYSDDLTNWWVPNRAGTEAMLRPAGLAIDKCLTTKPSPS